MTPVRNGAWVTPQEAVRKLGFNQHVIHGHTGKVLVSLDDGSLRKYVVKWRKTDGKVVCRLGTLVKARHIDQRVYVFYLS